MEKWETTLSLIQCSWTHTAICNRKKWIDIFVKAELFLRWWFSLVLKILVQSSFAQSWCTICQFFLSPFFFLPYPSTQFAFSYAFWLTQKCHKMPPKPCLKKESVPRNYFEVKHISEKRAFYLGRILAWVVPVSNREFWKCIYVHALFWDMLSKSIL